MFPPQRRVQEYHPRGAVATAMPPSTRPTAPRFHTTAAAAPQAGGGRVHARTRRAPRGTQGAQLLGQVGLRRPQPPVVLRHVDV